MNEDPHNAAGQDDRGAGAVLVKCEDIQALLFDYMTRELGPSRADLVREHLRRCPACQAAAAEVQTTLALLQDASHDGPPVPDRLSPKHRERISWALAHPLREWIYRRHGSVSVLVAFVALALTLLILKHYGVWGEPDEPPVVPVTIVPGTGGNSAPPKDL